MRKELQIKTFKQQCECHMRLTQNIRTDNPRALPISHDLIMQQETLVCLLSQRGLSHWLQRLTMPSESTSQWIKLTTLSRQRNIWMNNSKRAFMKEPCRDWRVEAKQEEDHLMSIQLITIHLLILKVCQWLYLAPKQTSNHKLLLIQKWCNMRTLGHQRLALNLLAQLLNNNKSLVWAEWVDLQIWRMYKIKLLQCSTSIKKSSFQTTLQRKRTRTTSIDSSYRQTRISRKTLRSIMMSSFHALSSRKAMCQVQSKNRD